jgi:hypothetical protein
MRAGSAHIGRFPRRWSPVQRMSHPSIPKGFYSSVLVQGSASLQLIWRFKGSDERNRASERLW